MRRLFLVVALLVSCLVLDPGDALAFPPRVQKIYEAAKADLKAKRSFQALEKFRQCLDLVQGDDESTWNLLMAVSLTYEQMGQLDHAVEYYRRFLTETDERATTLEDKWQMRREKVVAMIRQHEKVVLELRGLVEIRSRPAGGEIRVDGVGIGADGVAHTPFIVYLKPGQRSIKLTLAGHLNQEKVLDVTKGGRIRVKYDLIKKKRGAASVGTKGKKGVKKTGKTPGKKAAKGKKKRPKTISTRKSADASPGIWPWVFIGTGVGALGAGYTFTSKAQDNADAIDALETDGGYGGLKSELDTNNMIAGSLYTLGSLAVVGGVYLYFAHSGQPARTKSASSDGSVPMIVIAPWKQGAYVQTGWAW